MRDSRLSSSETAITKTEAATETESVQHKDNYPWVALSVTTVGALLASMQGSALLIALPSIMADLHATFFTIMWYCWGISWLQLYLRQLLDAWLICGDGNDCIIAALLFLCLVRSLRVSLNLSIMAPTSFWDVSYRALEERCW